MSNDLEAKTAASGLARPQRGLMLTSVITAAPPLLLALAAFACERLEDLSDRAR